MVQVLLAVHLLTALIIIGLILMQQGKGAEAGASFGAGASQTIFGSAGSWNFFSRMTAIFATVFFVTSITLAVLAKKTAGVDDSYLPEMEQTELPQSTGEQEIPALNSEGAGDEIPAVEGSEEPGAIPEGNSEGLEQPPATVDPVQGGDSVLEQPTEDNSEGLNQTPVTE